MKFRSRCGYYSPREHLEGDEGTQSVCSHATNRLDVQEQVGSHRKLQRGGWPNFTFCFHDGEEIGPAALSKIGKDTGLRPEDL
ncbi:MAG: type II toxin-antitoxin system HicA family toxin [Bryobacteraceae bacterium]|nr:type II toxin-antitoxin system HicA family toxin [Bryobacteraceae bacterium]